MSTKGKKKREVLLACPRPHERNLPSLEEGKTPIISVAGNLGAGDVWAGDDQDWPRTTLASGRDAAKPGDVGGVSKGGQGRQGLDFLGWLQHACEHLQAVLSLPILARLQNRVVPVLSSYLHKTDADMP